MVPKTLLSYVYHITQVAPYREEMHHDMSEALRRFEVNQGMMRQVAGGESAQKQLLADIHRASYEVERASYENRATGLPLNVPMPTATQNLFNFMPPFLEWELTNGVPGPNQPEDGERASLLRAVYHLFYSKDFRDYNADIPELESEIREHVNDAQLSVAWQTVHAELNHKRSASADARRAALRTLASAMAVEYALFLWPWCW